MKPWKVLHTRYLLKRWWMNLREDHVQLPGGVELPEFHVIEYPDWVCVIALTETGEMLMVEQYRHGIRSGSLEFPAGAIDPGEAPLAAAQRELLEETGYQASEWTYLGRCAPEPSKHTNHAFFYVAQGARAVQEPEPEQSEHLVLRLLAPQEVLKRADEGGIVHGTHLTALFWAHFRGVV